MPWSNEPLYPAPATEKDAYANLAFAVLSSLVADLRGPNPRRRKQAREAVQAGAHQLWLDLLELEGAPRERVLGLLCELAH
jgi:hypothetical protein